MEVRKSLSGAESSIANKPVMISITSGAERELKPEVEIHTAPNAILYPRQVPFSGKGKFISKTETRADGRANS
jgi:hypothetical protein